MKFIKLLSRAGATLLLALAFVGCSAPAPTATPQRRDLAARKAEQAALTPAKVLESLQDGNDRS